MAHPDSCHVPTKLVDEIANYLDASSSDAFRSACEQADMHQFRTIVDRFFSTWRTSLMGPHLQRLEEISKHEFLRDCVKTICIMDESDENDPWNTSTPLISPYIWPRDETGKVIARDISVANLKAMFIEKRLCPEVVKIRDYRIPRENFGVCPKTTLIREYRLDTTTRYDPEPVAALAKDIIEDGSLALVSISTRLVRLESSDKSILHLPDLHQAALAEPAILETTIRLSPQLQGCGLGFSSLLSAEVRVAPYWLEKMLYHSPVLEELNLYHIPLEEAALSHGNPLLKLKRFEISHTSLHAQTLLGLLACSKLSLVSLTFIVIKLDAESAWCELLSHIGSAFPNLTSFRVSGLWKQGSKAIDFMGFGEHEIAEELRSGLTLQFRGSPNYRRLNKVMYDGPNAGVVLQKLLTFAKWKHSLEIVAQQCWSFSFRKCSCNR